MQTRSTRKPSTRQVSRAIRKKSSKRPKPAATKIKPVKILKSSPTLKQLVYRLEDPQPVRINALLSEVRTIGLLPVLETLDAKQHTFKSTSSEAQQIEADILSLFKTNQIKPDQVNLIDQPETLAELIGDCPPGKIQNILHPARHCIHETGILGQKVYQYIDIGGFKDFHTPNEIEDKIHQEIQATFGEFKPTSSSELNDLTDDQKTRLQYIRESINGFFLSPIQNEMLYNFLRYLAGMMVRHMAIVILVDCLQNYGYSSVASGTAQMLFGNIPFIGGIFTGVATYDRFKFKKSYQFLKNALEFKAPVRLSDFMTYLETKIVSIMNRWLGDGISRVIRTIFVFLIIALAIKVSGTGAPSKLVFPELNIGALINNCWELKQSGVSWATILNQMHWSSSTASPSDLSWYQWMLGASSIHKRVVSTTGSPANAFWSMLWRVIDDPNFNLANFMSTKSLASVGLMGASHMGLRLPDIYEEDDDNVTNKKKKVMLK